MATVQTTSVIDDLDGSSEAKPVRFSIEKSEYEIDLSSANIEQLYDVLSPFIVKARRVKKIGVERRVNDSQIREWAKSQGIDVSDRGRLPKGLREKYFAVRQFEEILATRG